MAQDGERHIHTVPATSQETGNIGVGCLQTVFLIEERACVFSTDFSINRSRLSQIPGFFGADFYFGALFL